jgi:phytanoyl-CoA hydroxylase
VATARRCGDGTEFDTLDAAPLPDPADLVPLEAAAGTMVVLHGVLPHWSDVNRSAVSRHAYSLHCISGAADYPAWNWIQRPADFPLRRLDRSVEA